MSPSSSPSPRSPSQTFVRHSPPRELALLRVCACSTAARCLARIGFAPGEGNTPLESRQLTAPGLFHWTALPLQRRCAARPRLVRISRLVAPRGGNKGIIDPILQRVGSRQIRGLWSASEPCFPGCELLLTEWPGNRRSAPRRRHSPEPFRYAKTTDSLPPMLTPALGQRLERLQAQGR